MPTEPQDMPVAYQHSDTWKDTPNHIANIIEEEPISKKWQSTPAGQLGSYATEGAAQKSRMDNLLEVPSESERSHKSNLSQIVSGREFNELPVEKQNRINRRLNRVSGASPRSLDPREELKEERKEEDDVMQIDDLAAIEREL